MPARTGPPCKAYDVDSCTMGAAGRSDGPSEGGGLIDVGLEMISRSIGMSQLPSILMDGGSRNDNCCEERYD